MTYSLGAALLVIRAAAILRGFTGFAFGLAAAPLLRLALRPAGVGPLVATLKVRIGGCGLNAAWER